MVDYRSKMYGNRNPYFEALLKEGTNTSPIGAHSQGMSRLAFALLAGLERGQMDREREHQPHRQAHHTVPSPGLVESNDSAPTTTALPTIRMPFSDGRPAGLIAGEASGLPMPFGPGGPRGALPLGRPRIAGRYNPDH
jgi:hypothetical protein